MNIYRTQFSSCCPSNGDRIFYQLEIQSNTRIMAEDIEAACHFAASYHEDIAEDLFRRFSGRQVLTARHGHVQIQTIRGE